MSDDQHQNAPPTPPGSALAWVLVAVLAGIAVAAFATDGATQSAAITGVLIVGLLGIVLTMRTPRGRGPRGPGAERSEKAP